MKGVYMKEEVIYTKEQLTAMHKDNKLFAMHLAYSDVNPYKVLKVVSEITLQIQEMRHENNKEQPPKFIPGGFSAICVDTGGPRIITEDPKGDIITIRRSKRNPKRWVHKGRKFYLDDHAFAYYDHNF